MVLVEALAAGRAVVAPAAGGPKEILTEGLYPPGDADAAVAEIGRPWRTTTRRQELAAAREEHFDVRESTRRLTAAIDEAQP